MSGPRLRTERLRLDPFAASDADQLLYGLRPAFHGRGLATEAARRVCAFALDVLEWREVWATVDVPNAASARVLDRIGMVLDRTTDDGPWGTAFYVLRRPDRVREPGGA